MFYFYFRSCTFVLHGKAQRMVFWFIFVAFKDDYETLFEKPLTIITLTTFSSGKDLLFKALISALKG